MTITGGLLCFLVSHCKYLQPLLQQNPDFSAEALLHKIEAYRCFRASDLISILSSLLSQSESEPDKYPMDLLIIDSVAAPFRLPDFATVKERCEMLNKMAKLLNQFTIVTDACIVLTNHITTKLVESQWCISPVFEQFFHGRNSKGNFPRTLFSWWKVHSSINLNWCQNELKYFFCKIYLTGIVIPPKFWYPIYIERSIIC